MVNSNVKPSCFIIMPITTPIALVEQYGGDADHFAHVLEHLFIPALEIAGFEAVPPKSTGSLVIQAEIIKQLSSCKLVLCDMSILNPNVFFEFGIRTALDKPVALVVDDKTAPIPFDTSILNFHEYDSSLTPWTLAEQKQKLANHVQDSSDKSQNRNELWKYFGVTQTGTFRPEDAELGEKVDVIIRQLSALERQQEWQIEERRLRVPDGAECPASKSDTMAPVRTHMELLTSAEKEILQMIFDGKSNREIADSLKRSVRTIEVHRSRIMRKLGVANMAGLVKLAVLMGWVE